MQFERQNLISPGTSESISEFLKAEDKQQRFIMDDPDQKKNAQSIIRSFFDVIKNIKSDAQLVAYCLAHLDGILEDRRVRIAHFIAVQNDFKNPENLIKTLDTFINTDNSKENMARDMASHVLALLIEGEKYEKCSKTAREFLEWLIINQRDIDNLKVSCQAYTFSLMVLLKKNELALEFTKGQGFKILSDLLDDRCLHNGQIAYNVVCMLWILSYHEFTFKHFEDYTIAIIEKVSKILDFFNWEKIVRIMLVLFDNLKEIETCQEHLSDIDSLSLIIKLQNRHWVDDDINKKLE